jgi:pyruvate kinase
MVTMPAEAADDYRLVRDLVAAGMDVMRVNCAHDDHAAWEAMAAHLRRAVDEVGRPCRLLADLGGPKMRTGRLAAGERVVHWRPRHDLRGGVRAAARVWVTPAAHPELAPEEATAALPVAGGSLTEARPGDELRFVDTRGRRRTLRVVGRGGSRSWWAEARAGAYVESETTVEHLRAGAEIGRLTVGDLPRTEEPLVLRPGDHLVLTASQEPGRAARVDREGQVLVPARIPCTLPDVFEFVAVGDRVALDDGRMLGVARACEPGEIEVEIRRANPRGSRLRGDKGVNFPDTLLAIPGLTAKDLADLDFVVRHADLVGLSFVKTPQDILRLEEELAQRGGEHVGIILKIETRAAFEHLPALLLTALRSPPVGVMVARGDLAVELGFERLAEVQEEILWLCEAAHVPVIWATQVLEGLAKKATPSRAEVTDAAMSGRAECVMLNKGPHVVEAVRFLDDVLGRMQEHQRKKRAMLRRLRVSMLAG